MDIFDVLQHSDIESGINYIYRKIKLCFIQNWRWQKNCRNMFLKSVVHFL